MHNAAFAALGLDWAYVPLPVTPSRMGEAVRGLGALGFVGANVTSPHKVAVIPFCGEIDATAERAGSVNTLLLQDDVVLGSSTEMIAIVNSRAGTLCTASTTRCTRRSKYPPMKPVVSPMTEPTMVPKPTVRKPA